MNFYSRFRKVFLLAAPLSVTSVSHGLIGVVDTIMSGRYSTEDLAAVAIGNSFWVPLFMFIQGVLMTTGIKASPLAGSLNHKSIGILTRQMLYIAFIISLITVASLLIINPLIRALPLSTTVAEKSIGYLHGISFGLFSIGFYQVLRGVSESLNHVFPVMIFSIIGVPVNIVLNYILIYGKLGLPELGAVGCGIASSISMIFSVICIFIYVHNKNIYQKCEIFTTFDLPNIKTITVLLRVGIPLGIAFFIETSIFSVISILLSTEPEYVISGHQIALNFATLVCMFNIAMSTATSILIGQSIGAHNMSLAYNYVKTGIFIGIAFALISGVLMFCFREQIASIYSTQTDVISVASSLLVIAALFQLGDSIQITAAAALRAYQHTAIIMFGTLTAYWLITVPFGLSLSYFNIVDKVTGLWIGLVVGLSIAAVLFVVKIFQIAKINNY